MLSELREVFAFTLETIVATQLFASILIIFGPSLPRRAARTEDLTGGIALGFVE
jgi:hypothetical protein